MNFEGTNIVARGMLGWQHAFGDTDPLSTARFGTGNSFTVSGAPINKNVALIEAGLDFNLAPNAILGIGYIGQVGSGSYSHGANAMLKVKF
ncbi:autotransporter domain-containing protein [Rhizobium sp. P38BS-XIX]|nr:autotransporter domain-containing protein [Rhizobium sp. P38BS-XIX]